jgi:hypothetical protein
VSVTVSLPTADTRCFFLVTRPDGLAGSPGVVDPGWATPDLDMTLDTANAPGAWFDGNVVLRNAEPNTPVELLVEDGPSFTPTAQTNAQGAYSGNLAPGASFTDYCEIVVKVGRQYQAIWFC